MILEDQDAKILAAVKDRDFYLKDLSKTIGMPIATLNRHVKDLRDKGMLKKEGRYFYRVPNKVLISGEELGLISWLLENGWVFVGDESNINGDKKFQFCRSSSLSIPFKAQILVKEEELFTGGVKFGAYANAAIVRNFPGKGYYIIEKEESTQEQFERITKQEAVEKHKREQMSRRQEELRNMLKDHYQQLVDEVYQKWFETPSTSLSVIFNISVRSPESRAEYKVSLAEAVCGDEFLYDDGDIATVELKEPSHQNQQIANEAVEHLKCYPETWKIWSNAKTDVDKNLAEIKRLWRDLENGLTKAIKLTEWHGYWHGYDSRPYEYYSLRNTFSFLWLCVQDNRFLSGISIRQEGRYYTVSDLGQSPNRQTMEDFIQVIKDLATDKKIQKKMKTIFTHKTLIEKSLGEFRVSLSGIADDVKRRHERLKCSCQTCKHWLEEM